ncbi:RluA family pseudouridine synthase [Spirochaeta africana]|uniref:23S RNA-specific pseudouridylate synthase n=1 Tax=Spirochaeta africana (strain ATCC 700263 / DSM 8902 / Z-7692) TaxID=889378 RepID=H9UKM4_SPIAZ|nr:RluA family pseudouridine synthase [Spirochaeta africana]AFG38067.1 23S RNA-specific pseudouridylate synthase [Spirochaeta africana DSM 8902]
MEWREFTLTENDAGRRLDVILRHLDAARGLSGLFAAIRKGLIRLNGKKARPDSRVNPGDTLSIAAFLLDPSDPSDPAHPQAGQQSGAPAEIRRPDSTSGAPAASGPVSSPPQAGTTAPEATPSEAPAGAPPVPVLFESDHLIAVLKPPGMLVHDGPASLEARLRPYLQERIPPSVSFRPGPLHRLDRNTSGIVCFSKSLAGARWFTESLQQNRIAKYYLAVLEGELPPGYHEIWLDTLERRHHSTSLSTAGQAAETHICRLGTASRYQLPGLHTMTGVRIVTGRTHQIRAQAAGHGHPVLGDAKYGSRISGLGRGLLLHAAALVLPAWEYGEKHLIQAPLPRRWYRLLQLQHDQPTAVAVSSRTGTGYRVRRPQSVPAPRDTESRDPWLDRVMQDLILI